MKNEKCLSLLLCCVMCLTVIPVSVFAQAIQPKGITSFTGQDLVDAGLIEDINFANAIADSILADTDNFYGDYYGDTSKTMESYNTLEEVLQNFTGVIDAKDRGITSVVGFPTCAMRWRCI